MKERVFTFGAEQILMGVLTEPDAANARPNAPVLVVSNVGLNPRTGPQRAWVELARAAARRGFSTFRFDLNGLGDSLPRRDARGDIERAAIDLKEALDFLEKRGLRRAVTIGMCSGVDPVHRVATVDPRVAAAVFLDGYVYETPRSKLRAKLRQLSPYAFARGIRRRLPRVGGTEVGQADEIYVRDYPDKGQFAGDLEGMLARQTRLLFIYTSGWFNSREQFFEMLQPADFKGRIDVDYRPDADHTYIIPAERQQMVERVTTWVADQFP